MALLLAVDVGTAAARAGLFDGQGELLTTASAAFPLHRPQEHHAVYVMDDIWDAVASAVRHCVVQHPSASGSVAGIAFDATSSLVLNHVGAKPLAGSADVFSWMDHRAEAEAEEITLTGERILRYMGGSLSPEMHLPKLLWLRRHDPETWSRVTGVRDLCDELARRTTGEAHHSLCGLACKWAYLPNENEGWQHALLDRFDLGELPTLGSLKTPPKPVGAEHGVLRDAAAAAFGLRPGIPVAIGLIDAEAGMLGTLGASFASRMNTIAAVIGGTSTCVMALANDERLIPGVWGPFKDAIFPELWLHEAGQSLSGAALDAVLVQHPTGPHQADSATHARVSAEILEILDREGPAFCVDRHVVPDWLGNRSPFGGGRVRALLCGIGTEETHRSFLEAYYATARGLVLQIRHIVEHMNASGYAISRLMLSGGHLRNPLLMRLYRDAARARVVTADACEPVLLGTAMAASVAAGIHPHLTAALDGMSADQDEASPDPRWMLAHERAYRIYLLLSSARNEVRKLGSGLTT